MVDVNNIAYNTIIDSNGELRIRNGYSEQLITFKFDTDTSQGILY